MSTHPFAHHTHAVSVLASLHELSLTQERDASLRGSHFPKSKADDAIFESQLVALDEDKAKTIYTLLRAIGATSVVEAGTSFGVSLIYLTAAVLDNISASETSGSSPPLVVGTEMELSKFQIAQTNISKAFPSTPLPFLHILHGDLLQTLPAFSSLTTVDALLLDIWANLALPTLKILLPKFHKGTMVFIDNMSQASSAERYAELLAFLNDRKNGFVVSNLGFDGGLGLAVYVGNEDKSS
ncbi:putative O-methyltransferase [Flagelloscypha sp. PMI_526]|nr:putative O-methyltransferase [Flagelloscypha sp. PMI_526]